MRAIRLVLALAAAAALGDAPARSADPVKIRAAWVVPVANWPSIMFAKPELARHLGISYTFEAIHFNGTPPMITALVNGEIEIGNLAYSSLALAIENAGMDDLRVIADEFQDGVPGYYTDEFFVLKDGTIEKVEDLKGRIVATNAVGSAVDIASRAMLKKHGLEDKRDYTVVEAAFPTMKAMLLQRKVDMIPGVRPFSLDPELRANARVLFRQTDAIGTTQMIVWAARKRFIDGNRAAMVDFMEDALRAVHWFLDPANRKEVAEIAAKVSKRPAASFESWLFTKEDAYRDPNLIPNLTALQDNIATTKELGFIKTNIDVQKHADLSLVDEAAKRLSK
jgi:NitT/TauT family transport system substrate-binding protein